MQKRAPEVGKDRVYRLATALVAASIPVLIFAILIFILQYSYPAIVFNGVGFLTSVTWNLGNLNALHFVTRFGIEGLPGASFGVVALMFGTLASSAIALLIAVPVSIATALFLVNEAPRVAREPLASFVDLLAGIPSVVYGLWGIVILVPVMEFQIAPALKSAFGFIPGFGGNTGSGYGLLTAGIVLALMITPIISSTVREAFAKTPVELKEGALALGCTKWEMQRKIMIPTSKATIAGASMLGLGRAFGETMAILMVGGGAWNYITGNIYGPISTMATAIVSLLDSAFTDPTSLALYSLAEVALTLFLITLLANMVARLFVSGGIARVFVNRGDKD